MKVEGKYLYSYLKRETFNRGASSNQVQRIIITWHGQKDKELEPMVHKARSMLKNVIRQSKSVLCAAKKTEQI